MLFNKMLRKSPALVVGLLVTAAPAYANWGAGSPWATAGQTVYCNHSHPGNVAVRRARLIVIRTEVPQECVPVGPEIPGCVPLPPIYVDNAVTRNVSASGTADIVLAGYDYRVPPTAFLPYLLTLNDVPRNSDRWFTSVGSSSFNLQAQCYVSNNML